jgi:23S rRNA maturation-related 3'-5' exoribonuclease YhaM
MQFCNHSGVENHKHRDKHGKGNICGDLVAKNEKLNKVVNDETLTDEQLMMLRICVYSWYINCIV